MTDKEKLLQEFISEMEKLFEISLKKIILYGSYARGDYKENSDMDIMILTSLSDFEIKKYEEKVYDIAFELGIKHSIMISINIKNEDHFNYWIGALPYYDNVQNEGIILWEEF